MAQTDNYTDLYKIQFNKNLTELNDLYCWSDVDFYPGTFNFNSEIIFLQEFEKLNLSIFPELSLRAVNYYHFFNNLDSEKKQNLIKYFSFYEKIFETVLKEADLPIELKYLAPALSAMNPNAVAFDGKSGIWQLSHFQVVTNYAQINKLIDERFNENISTIVAASQLRENFELFESNELAVTGFLIGNTLLKNTIQQVGIQVTFPEILLHLPEAVSEFLAAFQAMAVFLNVNKFEPKINLFSKKVTPETVEINRQLHFQQVAGVLNIPFKKLQFLNPQYKFSIVPGDKKMGKLTLPCGKGDDFTLWQDSIFNTYDSTLFQIVEHKTEYPPEPNRQYLRESVKDLKIDGKTKIQYSIKSGDVLGIIAEKYDVRVTDLKYWNNIYNERKIQVGQKLNIFVDDTRVNYFLKLENKKRKKRETFQIVEQIRKSSTLKVFEELNAAEKVIHIVQSGESPYVIARKYKGVTPEEILEWNGIDNPRKIQIGQKLIVYLKK